MPAPPDRVMIQRRFVVETPDGTYSDALVMPESEYRALTPAQIDELKQERVAAWRAARRRRPRERTRAESRDELRARRDALDEERAIVDRELVDLD